MNEKKSFFDFFENRIGNSNVTIFKTRLHETKIFRDKRIGKSYHHCLIVYSNLFLGKKCSVATKNIDEFKKQFEYITNAKIECKEISDSVYNIELINKPWLNIWKL
jgi:hypothetical protein